MERESCLIILGDGLSRVSKDSDESEDEGLTLPSISLPPQRCVRRARALAPLRFPAREQLEKGRERGNVFGGGANWAIQQFFQRTLFENYI